MKAKHIIAGAALLIALVGIGASLYFWKRSSTKQSGGGFEMPTAVQTVEAKSEMWQPMGRLVGTVIAKRSVNLANEIVGVVTEVGFESGDVVEPGQVLLKLDAAIEQADLAAAEAALRLSKAAVDVAAADVEAARTTVEWSVANYNRYKSAPPKAVSESDVDRARTDLERAQATLKRQESYLSQMKAEVEQSQARVDQIRTTLAKKTLKAPFRARAGMRNIHPGQYIPEGTTVVTLHELTDDIYVDFAIPQEYTPLVYPGTTVTATSNILGRGAANTVQISVLSMDASVNPVTRNIRVRTSVPNKDQVLKPGMFIDVEVPIGPSQQVVTIPTTAVRRGAYGDHVYLVQPPPPPSSDAPPPPPPADPNVPPMPPPLVAKQQMVKLGTNLGDRVIVLSGIQAGQKIAAAGSFKLHEGAKVMEAPPTGAPGSPPGSGESPSAAMSGR